MSSGLEGNFPLPRECGHRCSASVYTPSEQARCCRCVAAVDWFRLNQRTAMLQNGRTVTFVERATEAGWALPAIDVGHLGWHAGLRRPAVYGAPSAFRSPAPVRVHDSYGISSGRGFDERYFLCTYCRESVRAIPAWLFWHARGWTPSQARYIVQQEGRTVRASAGVAGWIAGLPKELVPWAGWWSEEQRQDTRHTWDSNASTFGEAVSSRREFVFSLGTSSETESPRRTEKYLTAGPRRVEAALARIATFFYV